MLQLFRNYQLPTVLLVLGYLLLLSLNTWLYPHDLLATVDDLPSSLGRWLMQWLSHPTINRIAFVVLVFFQALAANALVNYFKLAKQSTFIPAIGVILMYFVGGQLDVCSPVVLANCFLVWALQQLWMSGEKRVSLGVIFNIGFATAMAALCYHGYSVLFLWMILAWMLVRAFDPQEFILLLGGYGVPFFLMGTYHFLNDDLGVWWQQEVVQHYIRLVAHYSQDPTWFLSVGLMAFVLLLGLFQWGAIQFKTNAREKKAQQSVLLLAVILCFSFLLQAELYTYHFLVFAVPLGILFSLSVQAFQSRAWAELLHLLLLLSVIGLQYRQFFFG